MFPTLFDYPEGDALYVTSSPAVQLTSAISDVITRGSYAPLNKLLSKMSPLPMINVSCCEVILTTNPIS